MNRPKCPHCGKETTWTNFFEHSWEDDPIWDSCKTNELIEPLNELIEPLLEVSDETLKVIRKSNNTEFDMCNNCGEVVS